MHLLLVSLMRLHMLSASPCESVGMCGLHGQQEGWGSYHYILWKELSPHLSALALLPSLLFLLVEVDGQAAAAWRQGSMQRELNTCYHWHVRGVPGPQGVGWQAPPSVCLPSPSPKVLRQALTTTGVRRSMRKGLLLPARSESRKRLTRRPETGPLEPISPQGG